MKCKRIAAFFLAACTVFSLVGCGKTETPESSGSGSGVTVDGQPTLEQIYAANTLEAYQKAGIQPSLSTCLREGEEKVESNYLLTLYFDKELGLITRFRDPDLIFRYYFNKDGTNFMCEADEDENVTMTILAGEMSDDEDAPTYPEKMFQRYSFGSFSADETIVSCEDNGDTYHIVTDISAASFQDSSGSTYAYSTQEYDVEKKTLRILDTFRTYKFTDHSGNTKECTLSRCMTYGEEVYDVPDCIAKAIRDTSWTRTFTIEADGEETEIAVPDSIPVLVQAPDGYEAYKDSEHEVRYLIDLPEDKVYQDRTIYIAPK
ncbi:MAG: hypothetical protein Q4P20_08180 [Eubacteriales bacterium]|nr:hypothetical protein [Eubacteriales bacterium]